MEILLIISIIVLAITDIFYLILFLVERKQLKDICIKHIVFDNQISNIDLGSKDNKMKLVERKDNN